MKKSRHDIKRSKMMQSGINGWLTWFFGLGGAEVCPVEERVNGGIGAVGEVRVPVEPPLR
jgi:hypothetical protein